MQTNRLIRLLGFALGIVGAILLLQHGVTFSFTLQSILNAMPPLVLGLVAVGGAFLMITRRPREGGLICVIVGVVGFVVLGLVTSVIVLVAGVLGLVASAT